VFALAGNLNSHRARSLIACLVIGIPLLAFLPSCAPRRPPRAVSVYLENPLASESVETLTSQESLRDFQKGWRQLESGDTHGAGEAFARLKRERDWRRPAQVAAGYVSLVDDHRSHAIAVFREVLSSMPSNLSALLGLAQGLEAEGSYEGAYEAYRSALAVSPTHSFAQLRADITRLQVTDGLVRRATESAAQGKVKDAISTYEKAVALSPDRASLYMEIGNLYLRQSDYPRAITYLQQAVDKEPQQTEVKSRLAEALFLNDNLEQAQGLYRELLEADPKNSDYGTRLRMVEDAIKWRMVPQQFKEIPSARVLSREMLAALIAVKVPEAVGQRPGGQDIAIDIGGWSREYVLQVVGSGIMDVYPGHLFAPREPVRRGEAASAAARVIRTLRDSHPVVRPPKAAVRSPADVARGHIHYADIQTCLLHGLFQLDARGDFNPAYTMTGEEGVRLADSLAHLIGR